VHVAASPAHDQPDTFVRLESRRRERAQAVQRFQHAIPAFALLYEGWHGVTTGERGFGLALAICEIASSALLLGSVARSLRAARRGRTAAAHDGAPPPDAYAHDAVDPHVAHGIDWVDIFAAGVLSVEAWSQWYTRHHIARPTILLAATTLAMGLLHGRLAGRIARRRALRLTDQGLAIGGRFFRRFSARWDEIDRIDIGDDEATITTMTGRSRRIDLADLRNATAVRSLLYAARARRAPSADAMPPVPR